MVVVLDDRSCDFAFPGSRCSWWAVVVVAVALGILVVVVAESFIVLGRDSPGRLFCLLRNICC